MDADDVLEAELEEGADLPLETEAIPGGRGADHLEGHVLAPLLVVDAEDPPHAALSDDGEDPVAGREIGKKRGGDGCDHEKDRGPTGKNLAAWARF